MTGGAVLAADRVLPQERAAFLRVARGAGFIDRVALAQQLDVLGSVRIVTGGALHLSFTDRHMRGLVHLAHLLAMTLHAGLGDRAGLETRLSDLASCTLWHVAHDMLCESCLLPSHWLCSLRL